MRQSEQKLLAARVLDRHRETARETDVRKSVSKRETNRGSDETVCLTVFSLPENCCHRCRFYFRGDTLGTCTRHQIQVYWHDDCRDLASEGSAVKVAPARVHLSQLVENRGIAPDSVSLIVSCWASPLNRSGDSSVCHTVCWMPA